MNEISSQKSLKEKTVNQNNFKSSGVLEKSKLSTTTTLIFMSLPTGYNFIVLI